MVPELGIEYDTVEFKQIKESMVNLKTIFFPYLNLLCLVQLNIQYFRKTIYKFWFYLFFFSILIAMVFFIYKILFWNSFELGIAQL